MMDEQLHLDPYKIFDGSGGSDEGLVDRAVRHYREFGFPAPLVLDSDVKAELQALRKHRVDCGDPCAPIIHFHSIGHNTSYKFFPEIWSCSYEKCISPMQAFEDNSSLGLALAITKAQYGRISDERLLDTILNTSGVSMPIPSPAIMWKSVLEECIGDVQNSMVLDLGIEFGTALLGSMSLKIKPRYFGVPRFTWMGEDANRLIKSAGYSNKARILDTWEEAESALSSSGSFSAYVCLMVLPSYRGVSFERVGGKRLTRCEWVREVSRWFEHVGFFLHQSKYCVVYVYEEELSCESDGWKWSDFLDGDLELVRRINVAVNGFKRGQVVILQNQ